MPEQAIFNREENEIIVTVSLINSQIRQSRPKTSISLKVICPELFDRTQRNENMVRESTCPMVHPWNQIRERVRINFSIACLPLRSRFGKGRWTKKKIACALDKGLSMRGVKNDLGCVADNIVCFAVQGNLT